MSSRHHLRHQGNEPSSRSDSSAATDSGSLKSSFPTNKRSTQLKLQEQIDSSDKIQELWQFQKLINRGNDPGESKVAEISGLSIQRVKITEAEVPGLKVELETDDIAGAKGILGKLLQERKYDLLEKIDDYLRQQGLFDFLQKVKDEITPQLRVGDDLPMIPLSSAVSIKWWVNEGAGKVDYHGWQKIIGKAIGQIVESHRKKGTTFRSKKQATNVIYSELQKTEAYKSFEFAADSNLNEYKEKHKDPETSECPIFISAKEQAFGVDTKHPNYEQLTLAPPNSVFRWKVRQQDDRFAWFIPEWMAEGDIWESIPADQCTDNTLMTLGYGGPKTEGGKPSKIKSREDHLVHVKEGLAEEKSKFHIKNTEAHYEVAWNEIRKQAETDLQVLASKTERGHLSSLIKNHVDTIMIDSKYFEVAGSIMKTWADAGQSIDYDLATMYEAVGKKPRNAEKNKKDAKIKVDKQLFPGRTPEVSERFPEMEKVELSYAIMKFKEGNNLTSFQNKLLLDRMNLEGKDEEKIEAEKEVRLQMQEEVMAIDQEVALNSERLKKHTVMATRNADQGPAGIVNVGQQAVADVGDAYLLICGVDMFWVHHIVPVVAGYKNTIFTIDKAQGVSNWSMKKYDRDHQFFQDYPSGRSMVLKMEKVDKALVKK